MGKVTLISGEKGSGKTILASQFINPDKILCFSEYNNGNIFHRLNIANDIKKSKKIVVFDEVWESVKLHRIIELVRELNINLILITNQDIQMYFDYDIDYFYNLKKQLKK